MILLIVVLFNNKLPRLHVGGCGFQDPGELQVLDVVPVKLYPW